MFKYIICALFPVSLMAEAVQLDTGRWWLPLIDSSRPVELENSVFKTTISGIDHIDDHVYFLTVDGWRFRIANPTPETQSFYDQTEVNTREKVLEDWRAGDAIQFHKTVNRSLVLLCYNLNTKQMVDVEANRVEPNEKTFYVKGIHGREIWLSDNSLWLSSNLKLQKKDWVLLVNNHPWRFGDNSPAIAVFAPRQGESDEEFEPSVDLSRTDGIKPLQDLEDSFED